MAECAQCGKATSNPKFCGKSCAASFNNTKAPKRRSNSICRLCSAPTKATERRCTACKARDEAAKRDMSEQRISIRRLDGSEERVPFKRVHVSTRTIVGPFRAEELPATAPAEPFFRLLHGFLASKPSWLRDEERARYATLFREFSLFPVMTVDRPIPTEKLPVKDLSRASYLWLESLLGHHDPLLFSFALDAMDFLFALLLGRHNYGQGPELGPLVEIRPEPGRTFDDRSLRKRYTQDFIGRCPVLARVPHDARILDHDGSTVVAAGEEFGMRILRCHQSSDPPLEFSRLRVEWPKLDPFDRATEFAFQACLLITHKGSSWRAWRPAQEQTLDDGPVLRVPGHWIVALLDIYDDPFGDRPRPITTWVSPFA